MEGHHHMTPIVQWKTICEVKHLVQTMKHRVHKHLLLITCEFLFRTPQDVYPVQPVPLAKATTDIHSHPTRDWGKKASNLANTQPSLSAIFSQASSYPQSRNLGIGCPKLFCTTCGGYDHWRKDCPYDCHCDNCDSDSHTTHMCRAPPKSSPTPSPQPVICIYCGSSEHRSMECGNRPRDNREVGCVPSPASSRYSRDKQ